jgi:hypothetical protein
MAAHSETASQVRVFMASMGPDLLKALVPDLEGGFPTGGR